VIDYALFGAESRSLADLLTDDPDETEMTIELEFEHAGSLYRVRRGVQRARPRQDHRRPRARRIRRTDDAVSTSSGSR
jgi:DNA repair exonuclease SbcCD ATPase subunit